MYIAVKLKICKTGVCFYRIPFTFSSRHSQPKFVTCVLHVQHSHFHCPAPYITNYSTGTDERKQYFILSAISGFRSKLDENCAPLGYDAAGNGNALPTFRDNLSF